jgi:hypothetical protein
MVNSGTMTSSPSPMPRARRASVSAVVPDEQATPWVLPFQAANASSNRLTNGPCEEIQPPSMASMT